jgi:hypothetical protein
MCQGKLKTVEVTPAERPRRLKIEGLRDIDKDGMVDFKAIYEQLSDGDINWREMPHKLLAMGPGVLVDEEVLDLETEMPGNLSIAIKKVGAEPITIKVQQDGEEWEVTEEGLGELPKEIRVYVERVMGRNNSPSWRIRTRPRQLRLKDFRLHRDDVTEEEVERLQLPDRQAIRELLLDQASKLAPQRQTIKELGKTRKETSDGDYGDLVKQIEEIRKEIRELQKEREE